MIAVVIVSASVRAGAQTPRSASEPRSAQEEKRRKLLEEVGLEKQKSPPPAPATTSPGAVDGASPESGAGEPKPKPGAAAKAAPASAPSFRRTIHPALMATCAPCHREGGPAAQTRLILSGDAAADHVAVVRVVVVREPASSALLLKASGQAHAGGAPWPRESVAYARVLAWITRGARLDAPGAVAATPPPSASASASVRKKNDAQPSPPRAAPAPIAATAEPASAPIPPAPVPAAAPAPPPPASPPPPIAAAPAARPFASVHAILMTACSTCHRPGAPAAMTRLQLSGDTTADEASARALIDLAAPAQSVLLTKATGVMHGGGAIIPEGDPRYALLLAWATPPAPAQPVAPPAAPEGSVRIPPARPPIAPVPAPVVPPRAAYHHHGGVELPLGFLLNGRFDLDYERRQFTGDPFASGAVNALRSYHHFLFLSRDRAAEPCGISVEILALTFWEAHCRVLGRAHPVALTIAGGKILVPFGADPLFHQSYGGLAGFDQRILPPIWAQEGVAAHAVYERGDVVITDDLFVVHGYGLSRADGVLNLQNDFSPADDVHLGWGNRVGAAWKAVSAWYSAYFNPLGFDRHLFMQAIDVTVYRPRELPVLGHFSFGAGLLHADVAGGDASGVGGAGKDYYHFGSYFQVRYHPTDWLYVQYRQGLRTFDNRRALILDNTRLTSADGSTHNFGVVARHHGLTAGIYYFVNLEKVDEVPDDLFRVSVAYEF